VVVGWLHKIMPAEEERTSLLPIMLENLLGACKIHNIPVLLTVPANLHDRVKKLLGDVGPHIQIVAPEKLEAIIRKYL